MGKQVIDFVKQQINAATLDLHEYQPAKGEWKKRALTTAKTLVPWLEQHAKQLKEYVEGVLNAPVKLRQLWKLMKPHVSLPRKKTDEFDSYLTLDGLLRESITGEVVSKVITQFLLDQHGSLGCNGRSDYPDIFLKPLDYKFLPHFTRKGGNEFGASLKGGRPVRVPDGLEIKTCRKRVSVDCHFPHAGLHLVLVFSEAERIFTVSDILIAFLKAADYRRSNESTEATTRKFSFNGDRFISLLHHS